MGLGGRDICRKWGRVGWTGPALGSLGSALDIPAAALAQPHTNSLSLPLPPSLLAQVPSLGGPCCLW